MVEEARKSAASSSAAAGVDSSSRGGGWRQLRVKWSNKRGASGSEEAIIRFFGRFGGVLGVAMGRSGGSAMVEMETEAGAVRAGRTRCGGTA